VSTKEFVVTLKGKEKGGGRSNIGLWWFCGGFVMGAH
jgi:hypothetical protein